MIEQLEWDSHFFGCQIGTLTITDKNEQWPSANAFKKYDLVYVFSVRPLSISAPLMDVKINYKKHTEPKEIDSRIAQFEPHLHSYSQLLELAYLSGQHSRFLKDPFFGPSAFQRLYKKWIDTSISDLDTEVLVFVDQNKLEGFVTYTKKTENTTIGLLAVSAEAQGMGIGKKLIDAVETKLKKGTLLTVPTQKDNTGACEFYQKLGFTTQHIHYIYHYEPNSLQ